MSRKKKCVLEIFSEKHSKSQNFPVTTPQYFLAFFSSVKANKMKMKDTSLGEKDAGNNNLTERGFIVSDVNIPFRTFAPQSTISEDRSNTPH